MWWTPERTSRPGLFSETDTSWVSEHLLSAPPQGVRISLCVGSLEGSTVPHVQQLHQRLITAGVEAIAQSTPVVTITHGGAVH